MLDSVYCKEQIHTILLAVSSWIFVSSQHHLYFPHCQTVLVLSFLITAHWLFTSAATVWPLLILHAFRMNSHVHLIILISVLSNFVSSFIIICHQISMPYISHNLHTHCVSKNWSPMIPVHNIYYLYLENRLQTIIKLNFFGNVNNFLDVDTFRQRCQCGSGKIFQPCYSRLWTN